MDHRTLLLNSDYQPLKVVSWQKAICMWVAEKVEIIDTYDDFTLKSVSMTIKCPAVIRLLSYVKRSRPRVKFSRIGVFGRDNFACQYCRKQPGTPELTYDHVVPKARGGKTIWENIVTACITCNSRKGNRTPEEAGMRLLKLPEKPKERAYNQFIFNIPKTPDAWRSYLWWNQELENDYDKTTS